jgi:hypothetical protein
MTELEKKHKKITVGFIIQDYEAQKDGSLVCTAQEFISSDKEQYIGFDMVQPGFDYYVLEIWGLVEPQLHGPYSKEQAEQYMEDWPKKAENGDNTYHLITVSKGAQIDF